MSNRVVVTLSSGEQVVFKSREPQRMTSPQGPTPQTMRQNRMCRYEMTHYVLDDGALQVAELRQDSTTTHDEWSNGPEAIVATYPNGAWVKIDSL